MPWYPRGLPGDPIRPAQGVPAAGVLNMYPYPQQQQQLQKIRIHHQSPQEYQMQLNSLMVCSKHK